MTASEVVVRLTKGGRIPEAKATAIERKVLLGRFGGFFFIAKHQRTITMLTILQFIITLVC